MNADVATAPPKVLLDVGHQPAWFAANLPTGEEDQGTDTSAVHSLGDPVAILGGEGLRLVQQQMAAMSRGPHSELGLHIRWHREGHSIDVGRHVVHPFAGP